MPRLAGPTRPAASGAACQSAVTPSCPSRCCAPPSSERPRPSSTATRGWWPSSTTTLPPRGGARDVRPRCRSAPRWSASCCWPSPVRNFFVLNLPVLLASLSWRVRRHLGIDYLDRHGRPRQLSYQQLLRSFHALARAFDPLDPDISNASAHQRAEALAEFSFRLIQAGITTPSRPGHLAVDATLKWGWDRPVGLNAKVERRGHDGDAGPAPTLSEVIEGSDAAFERDPLSRLRGLPRRRKGPSTWGRGSAWVGRANQRKSVYGIALHAVTVAAGTAPPVIEAIAVTPAPALPAPAAFPLVSRIHERRATLRESAELGDVVADPAYSANPADWQLPLRDLGASPIFRLHRQNQAGRRTNGGVSFVDGRPYCSCIPDSLAEIPFPRFPARADQLVAYSVEVTKRRRFEMKPNTAFRSDGSRQFAFPHWDPERRSGGCWHCRHADGSPVVDENTGLPKPRCCSQATKVVRRDELGLYQDVPFGEAEWFTRWNARDRVEGSFGALKNLALTNWGRSYHHFVGLVRETLIATFAVVAHNFHTERTWRAKVALHSPPPRRRRHNRQGADNHVEMVNQPVPKSQLVRARQRPQGAGIPGNAPGRALSPISPGSDPPRPLGRITPRPERPLKGHFPVVSGICGVGRGLQGA